jgi:hypothetical protein
LDAGSDASLDDGRFVRASALCNTDAGSRLPGDECAQFVTCGNAGKCDLSGLTCCMGFGGFDDCGAFVGCDERDIARCDGPEDCPLGTMCCFEGGSTSCEESCAPGNEVCHASEDCSRGECVKGRYDLGIQLWLFWGFCEL